MNKNPKNVIFIMDDQHNADALSCLRECPIGKDGKKLVSTPHLDSLCRDGIRFNQAYTPIAICGPSRTSIFTGMFPSAHGHYGNDRTKPLDARLQNLAGILSEAGFRTGVFGKSHLSNCIDKHFEVTRTESIYGAELESSGVLDPQESELRCRGRFHSFTSAVAKEQSRETWTMNEALRFIDSDSLKPFFAWIAFERPHSPHSVDSATDESLNWKNIPVDWDGLKRFEETRMQSRPGCEAFWTAQNYSEEEFQIALARYFKLIEHIDEQIGRLLAHLDAQGIREETLIFFCSDHGDFAGQFGQIGKNLPGYDSLLRVPLIWSDPTRPDLHGRVNTGLWQTVDILPSILHRMGLPCPENVQGRSFVPSLEGWAPHGRDVVYFETPMVRGVRTREYKLLIDLTDPEHGFLYRMSPTPDECTNLWDAQECAAVKTRLIAMLIREMGINQFPLTACAESEALEGSPAWERLAESSISYKMERARVSVQPSPGGVRSKAG